MKNQSISSSTNQLIAKIDPTFKSLLLSLNHFELFTKQLKDSAKSNTNYIFPLVFHLNDFETKEKQNEYINVLRDCGFERGIHRNFK